MFVVMREGFVVEPKRHIVRISLSLILSPTMQSLFSEVMENLCCNLNHMLELL